MEVLPADTAKFTDKDKRLLSELSKETTQLTVTIPDDIALKDWQAIASTACRAYSRAGKQQDALWPVIGQLCAVSRKNKALWEGKYNTYKEFLIEEICAKFGVAQSDCWEFMYRVERFPNLTVGQFASVGRVRFRLLAQAIPKGAEEQKSSEKLFDKARSMSVHDFRGYCEEKGLLSPGESTGATIHIRTSKRVFNDWTKFCANPQIQAYCESDKPDVILDRLMSECSTEWLRRAEEAGAAA
jgi:hypothetical protein